MIRVDSLPKFTDCTHAFNYKVELANNPKFQVKGYYHNFVQHTLIEDGEKVKYWCSVYDAKKNIVVNGYRFHVYQYELGHNKYYAQITRHYKGKFKTKFFENLEGVQTKPQLIDIINSVDWSE